MRKTIQFSKFFLPSAIISVLLVAFGLFGYLTKGFFLGVDFKPGLMQEIRIAPSALSLKWHGTSNAILSFSRNNMYIVESGTGTESRTFAFPFSEYASLGSLVNALKEQLEELEVALAPGARENIPSQWLLFSSQGNPYLNDTTAFVIHYADPALPVTQISEIRASLAGYGQSVSVQSIGNLEDNSFMIRVEEKKEEERITSEQINQTLESYFGEGNIALLRSDYVGSRFSENLATQAMRLMVFTLVIILIYASIRFKWQYALGAVVAIIHDGIIIVAFVVWTQMEFTTSIIAAILTILGYSINNTIVVFDRIRENRRIYPDNSFTDVLNISLTGVLGRTIITTLTTMLAVLFLFIFTSPGSMKDFALALMIGMVSGVYTTLFIATGVVKLLSGNKKK